MTPVAIVILLILSTAPVLAQDHSLCALNIEFGIKDNEPNTWNGSLSIDKGEIVELRGHQFKEGESIGPNNSWTARTDPWRHRIHPRPRQPRLDAGHG